MLVGKDYKVEEKDVKARFCFVRGRFYDKRDRKFVAKRSVLRMCRGLPVKNLGHWMDRSLDLYDSEEEAHG